MSPRQFNILLKSIQQGSSALWNEFRKKQRPGFVPNLNGANLAQLNLQGFDLSGAYLENADLRGADLSGADLRGARLKGAKLEGARLEGTNLKGVRFVVVSARQKKADPDTPVDSGKKRTSDFVNLDDDFDEI